MQPTPLLEANIEDMAETAPPAATPVRRRLPGRAILRNPKTLIGVLILLFYTLLAVAAPVLAPGDPNEYVDAPHLEPSSSHLLGTTGQGQDVFAQLAWGARRSLGLGLMVGIVTTAVGIVMGLTAAYWGGQVDNVLSLVTNIFIIMPGLPLLVALAAVLPSGPLSIVLVLSITGWAGTARVLRSQALSLRQKDFASASIVSGESSARIIFIEILPNMASIATTCLLGAIIYGIGAQAALEFLGLGDIDSVSWGTILYWAGTNASLLMGAWWTFVPAGLSIALVAFALVMINYSIDEIVNPRLRTERQVARVLKRYNYRAGRATPVVRGRNKGAAS